MEKRTKFVSIKGGTELQTQSAVERVRRSKSFTRTAARQVLCGATWRRKEEQTIVAGVEKGVVEKSKHHDMLFEDLEFQRNDGMERIVIGGVCLCFWFARGGGDH